MFGWALSLFLVGSFLIALGTPKRDRRFTTGYKGNDLPNQQVVGAGTLMMAVAAILFAIWCNQMPEHIAATVAPDMAEPATTVPDLASPPKPKHKPKKKTEAEPYQLLEDD